MTRSLIAASMAASALALVLGSAPAAAQTPQDEARFGAAQDRFQRELALFRSEYDRYIAAQRRGDQRRYDDRRDNDDTYNPDYDAARYYRDGSNYRERVLSSDDRVYRGSDGRYYCRRSDGTTGLIVGAAAGGILGNVIDGGHSRTVGTLIGGAIGALTGRAVEQSQNEVRCR
jgi:hypothetical protein